MTGKHILIVEDEPKVAHLLQEYLEKEGYRTSIVGSGDQAVAQVRKKAPDLMLLDLMLPGMDGLAVCREVRKFSNIPIIMTTAKVEELDRLLGLEIGADDYICKPFSAREVVARVKAVLRRVHAEPVKKNLILGPIKLDENTCQALVNGNDLDLTRSEFRLLQVLMSQPGKVFARDELLSRVQGYDCDGYDRSIDTHIKNLRKKIAEQLPRQEIFTPISRIASMACGCTPFGSTPAEKTSNSSPRKLRISPSAIWLRAEFPVQRKGIFFFMGVLLNILLAVYLADTDRCFFSQGEIFLL